MCGEPELTGSVAVAATCAVAAGVLARCAELAAGQWAEAPAAAAQAEALRRRALALLPVAAAGYGEAAAALEAARHAATAGAEGDERRDWRLGRALDNSLAGPARLADLAADVAGLATEIAAGARPEQRADAAVAAHLAAGAAGAARHLVDNNLTVTAEDPRPAHAPPAQRAAEHVAARLGAAG
jgi:hypothetical protein